MWRILISFIFTLFIVVSLSAVSSHLMAGKQEKLPESIAVSVRPNMTVGEFGKENGLDRKVLKKIFDLKSPDELERQVIMRNLESKTQLAKNWEYFINDLQERIFDKGIFGFGKGKQWSVLDKFSTDPVVALRGWAFDMKLGMFAFDQLLVQASQIPNIMAISRYGVEAVAELPALRIAIADGRANVISHLGKKLQGDIKSVLVFNPRVSVLPPNSIPDTGIKAKRVIDKRKKG